METSTFKTASIYTLKKAVDYSEGAIVSKIVARKEAGNITLFAFDKGQNLSEHSAPFDAMVQVIEGEGTILINREAYKLKEGDMIIMPANIPHAVEAVVPFKMLLLMIKSN
ncbi:MAG: cupin domain-containing protein [Bacteroidales bacterium]|nr:cupin domain-containing protein [Bacteroidales bacterium]